MHKNAPFLLAIALMLPEAPGPVAAAEPAADSAPAPFVIRTWKVENGLPHNGVTAVLQTRDGYLWLGTQNGLARFDGVRFTSFGLREGLPNLTITRLLEDRGGALWIGTEGGLSRMQGGKFQNWTRNDGLAGNFITSLAEDGSGTVWVGTTLGLSQWSSGRFSTASLGGATNNSYIRRLVTDRRGAMWVATLNAGLFRIAGGGVEAVQGPPELPRVDAYSLFLDSQERLWVGLSHWAFKNGNSLLCLESNAWRWFGPTNGLPSTYLTTLADTANGSLWAGSLDEGIYVLNGDRFQAIRREDGLADEGLFALLVDSDQNVWAGTRAGGLQRLTPRRITTHPVLEDGVERLPTTLAQTSDGRIWVGTDGRGLFEWREGMFEQLLRQLPISGHKQVEALLASRDGGLWWGAGPALYQWKGDQLSLARDREPWLRGDRITSLYEDREESLWVGTLNGQLRRLHQGKFIAFRNAFSQGPVTAITQTPDGTLWAGTLGGGLNCIRDGTNTSVTTAHGLLSNLIRTLFVDDTGVLWIGTLGGGLSRWQDGRIQTFTTEHGLLEDSIVQIMEDDANNLWLGGNHGLMRVSRRDLELLAAGKSTRIHPWVLDTSDGMLSEQCVAGSPACLKTPDGKLFFATARGIAIFDEPSSPPVVARPLVRIEEVAADGRMLQGEFRGSSSETLSVPAGTSRLTFRYTGLSFGAPDKVRFRGQLEGIDPEPIELGTARDVTYSHIPPGEYAFHVTACNRYGEWAESGASLAFRVLPQFWQTWWFIGLGAVAVVGLLAGGIRLAERRRYQRRLRALEVDRATEQERSRIARDMHDEIGARLTQITLINAMTSRRPENTAEVRAQSGKIAAATRELTRSLDEIVWAVRPQNDNLESLIEYLGNATRDLCDGSNVRCWFTTPDQVPAFEITATVRHNLVLACREAVNNVLKHSGATELRMRVRLEDNSLTVSINDNGQGFDVAQGEAKRSGLLNIRQRMAECGGSCEITSTNSGGTDVRLHLPLSASAPGTPNSGNSRSATGGVA